MICVYCICWVTLKNNMSENKEKQKISSDPWLGVMIWLVSTWPISSTSLGWKLGRYSFIHAWHLGQVVLVGQTTMSSNLIIRTHTLLLILSGYLCRLFSLGSLPPSNVMLSLHCLHTRCMEPSLWNCARWLLIL